VPKYYENATYVMSSEIQYQTKELSCDEIKEQITKYGLWPMIALRIKNLEKIESECWKNYQREYDTEKRQKVLIDISNLQTIIANCYDAARTVLLDNAQRGISQ